MTIHTWTCPHCERVFETPDPSQLVRFIHLHLHSSGKPSKGCHDIDPD